VWREKWSSPGHIPGKVKFEIYGDKVRITVQPLKGKSLFILEFLRKNDPLEVLRSLTPFGSSWRFGPLGDYYWGQSCRFQHGKECMAGEVPRLLNGSIQIA